MATNIAATRDFVRGCFEKQPTAEDFEITLAFNMLDELEKRSLAERRQARDKRSYALYLTADGAALMRKLKPVLKAHEARMRPNA